MGADFLKSEGEQETMNKEHIRIIKCLLPTIRQGPKYKALNQTRGPSPVSVVQGDSETLVNSDKTHSAYRF